MNTRFLSHTLIGAVGIAVTAVFTLMSGSAAQAQLGKNWVDRSVLEASQSRTALAYSGSLYVASSDNFLTSAQITTSTNGYVWTEFSTGLSDYVKAITWNGSQFLAVASSQLATSTNPNGSSWNVTEPFEGASVLGIASSGTNVVAVGYAYRASSIHPVLFLSTNSGATWTERTLPSSAAANSLRAVTRTGSQWVAVGESGTIYTSPNGATWTRRTVPAMAEKTLVSVSNNNSLIVAVGTDNSDFSGLSTPEVWTSANGIAWARRNISSYGGLNSVVWTGSNFVAVGIGGMAATSADGITWTQQNTGTFSSLDSLAWDGTQVLAVGNQGAVFSSDLLPTVSMGAEKSTVLESDGVAKMTVYLSKPTIVALSIPLTITGTATVGTDYTAPGPVTFAIGDSAKVVEIPLTNDGVEEPQIDDAINGLEDEKMIVTLGSATGVHLKYPSSQTISIVDEDTPPMVNFSPVDNQAQIVAESVGTVAVGLELSWPLASSVTLPIVITGTASTGDYTGAPTSVTFDAGETLKTISLTIVNDEVEEILDETITVGLGTLPASVESGFANRDTFTISINDDDPATQIGRRWSLSQPTPSSPYLRGMTMAASSRVVMTNSGGKVIISDDAGATWSEKYTGNTADIGDVAFGNGILIGVGAEGAMIRSVDNGNSWIAKQIPGVRGTRFNAVAYANGEFIAVGSNFNDGPNFSSARVYASTDGSRWEERPVPNVSQGDLNSIVAMGDSGWAAVGTYYSDDGSGRLAKITSLILTSVDGRVWEDRSSAIPSAELYRVIWTGTSLVAFDLNPASRRAYTSPNGAVWTPTNLGSAGNAISGVWDGNKILAVGDKAFSTCTSAAGSPWTQRPHLLNTVLYDVLWTGSNYIATGNHSIFTSTNGTTWVPRGVGLEVFSANSNSFSRMTAAAWSGTQFAAVANNVGQSSMLFTSPNGTTWTPQKLPVAKGGLNSIAWSGTTFAAVGSQGLILTSTNGTAWSKKSQPGGTLDLKQVIWAGNQFVAVGGHSDEDWYAVGKGGSIVLTSPDGNTWTRRTIPTTTPIEGIAWDGSLFVAVGQKGLMMTSLNAVSWTLKTGSISNTLFSIARSGSEWVAVGTNRKIFRSTDADDWVAAASVPEVSSFDIQLSNLNDVMWTGSEFLCATEMGTVLHSPDGDNWTERVTKTTVPLHGLALGNTLITLGDQGTILGSGSVSAVNPTISFDVATSSQDEIDKSVGNVLVRLSKPAATMITVPLNATATNGMVLTGLLADVTLATPQQIIFRPGETARFVPIIIKGDNRVEEPELLHLSFGALPAGVGAGTQATHGLTINDNDQAVALSTPPGDRLLTVGSPLALSVGVSSGSGQIRYQWSKDGKVIPKATGPVYYLHQVRIADAGSYLCTVSNEVGSLPSSAALVGVYEVANRAIYLDSTKAAETTITQTASNNCLLKWYKDGSSTAIAPTVDFIFSDNNRSLKIKGESNLTGKYVCNVELASVPPGTGATWEVGTVSEKPILPAITLDSATIGTLYQSAIIAAVSPSKVSSWKATGLQAGLRLIDLGDNQCRIIGLPSVAGTKTVTLTATNGKGDTTATTSLVVNGLPSGLVGTSIGLIEREGDVNNHFGGRIQFTFASTGVFSGSYIVGSTTQNFSGFITAATATTATASATFLSGINSVTVTLNYDSTRPNESGQGTLVMTSPGPSGSTTATANFRTWTKHLTPAAYTGRYHFAIAVPSASVVDLSIPQGMGYGIGTVTAAGVVTFTGKLGDGSALTASSVINNDGSTIAYTAINKDRGSFMSIPKITLGSAPGYLDSTVADFADASWGRLNDPLTPRDYVDGWFPHALEISGGKYTPPATGQIVMGITDNPGYYNANLVFSQAGLDAASPVRVDFEILKTNLVANYQPLPFSTKVKITAATGLFSGTLNLSGEVNETPIKRDPIAYEGLIIPYFKASATDDAVPYQGVGLFKLPQLPSATISPMPSEKSTAILTGRVELLTLEEASF